MTTQPATLTLSAFLERCLAEDEAVAKDASLSPQPWSTLADGVAAHHVDAGWHVLRHDPARVLAEVEAKRAIVAECAEEVDGGTTDEGQGLTSGAILGGYVLRALASVYRDRDGFDPAWL